MLKKLKIITGIIANRPFTGPLEVAIDITRRCNLRCITCWIYSPLRKEKVNTDWAKEEMDFEFFKRIVNELKRLDVKKITIGGDGDPFIHPKIIEMLAYVKNTGCRVDTVTSGAYFDERKIESVVKLGIDSLTISTLAVTPKTYVATHPAQKEKVFEKVKRSIALLSELKAKSKQTLPYLTLVDVICNLNYFEIDKMINLARETGAEAVGFKRMSVIPDTKSLLLTESQSKELKEKLKAAKEKADRFGIKTNIEKYQAFLLSGIQTGHYTSKIYSKIPCYIGWLYSRILTNGDVVPCCGCYGNPIGNLHNSPFSKIWNSKEYQRFRIKSRNIVKDPSITKECSCRSCVHFAMNQGVYKKLHPFKSNQ